MLSYEPWLLRVRSILKSKGVKSRALATEYCLFFRSESSYKDGLSPREFVEQVVLPGIELAPAGGDNG